MKQAANTNYQGCTSVFPTLESVYMSGHYLSHKFHQRIVTIVTYKWITHDSNAANSHAFKGRGNMYVQILKPLSIMSGPRATGLVRSHSLHKNNKEAIIISFWSSESGRSRRKTGARIKCFEQLKRHSSKAGFNKPSEKWAVR